MSHQIQPRFIHDKEGARSEVVLSIEDYQILIEAWEDLEDARDFEEAKRTTTDFLTLEQLKKELDREG